MVEIFIRYSCPPSRPLPLLLPNSSALQIPRPRRLRAHQAPPHGQTLPLTKSTALRPEQGRSRVHRVVRNMPRELFGVRQSAGRVVKLRW